MAHPVYARETDRDTEREIICRDIQTERGTEIASERQTERQRVDVLLPVNREGSYIGG